MSEDFRTAMDLEMARRERVKVETTYSQNESVVESVLEELDGCPDSFEGNLRVNRYCKLQPMEYQKYGGEKVISFQLCPPRCYRDNWERCPYR